MLTTSGASRRRLGRRGGGLSFALNQFLWTGPPLRRHLREVAPSRRSKPRRIFGGRVGWLWRELVEAAQALPVSDLLLPENTGAPKPRPSRR